MNFVYRQVLQISALHIWLREVLFAYGAVEKPIGGGYLPSRLIKVVVPGKDVLCAAKDETSFDIKYRRFSCYFLQENRI
jgi:hypothetical protein